MIKTINTATAEQQHPQNINSSKHPYLQLEEDEYDPGDGEPPRGDHEEPVPDEPLVELAALGGRPVLLEVAGEEHAHRGEEHPRADHEGAVQLHEQVLARRQRRHRAQVLQNMFDLLYLGTL